MEVPSRELVMLMTVDGKIPFEEWFDGLQAGSFQIAVDARLTRVADGNFGDQRSVGKGVFELRVHKGPGFRVYYGLDGPTVVFLIGGGDKNSQTRDIKRAHVLWREYLDAK